MTSSNHLIPRPRPFKKLVGATGLEPARLAPKAPKTFVSAIPPRARPDTHFARYSTARDEQMPRQKAKLGDSINVAVPGGEDLNRNRNGALKGALGKGVG